MSETETTQVAAIKAERLGSLTRRISDLEHDLGELLRASASWPDAFDSLSARISTLSDEIESERSRDPARYEDSRLEFLEEALRALIRKKDGSKDSEPLTLDEATRELERLCFSCRNALLAITRTGVNVACRKLPDDVIFTARGSKARILGASPGAGENRRESGIPEIEYCPHWEPLLERKPPRGD